MGEELDDVEPEELPPNPTFESWLALHAYREEDAVAILKQALPDFIAAGLPTTEYLFLLGGAYRQALGRTRRRSDAARAIDMKEGASDFRMLSLRERHDAEAQLINLCWDMIFLLEKKILPAFGAIGEDAEAPGCDAKVFATTMQADFLRYLAEAQHSSQERRNAAAREAKAAFKLALSLADTFSLPANSATRLRAVQNYASMLAEDPKSGKEGLGLLDDALAEWENTDRREQERANLLGSGSGKKKEGGEASMESHAEGGSESLAWPPGEEYMEELRATMTERASELRDRFMND